VKVIGRIAVGWLLFAYFWFLVAAAWTLRGLTFVSQAIPMTPPAIRNQRIDFLRNFRKDHIFILLFDRAIWVTRRSRRSSTLWCCGILLRCILILLLVRGPITGCERQSNQNQESRYQNSQWLHFYFLLLFDDSLTHGNNSDYAQQLWFQFYSLLILHHI